MELVHLTEHPPARHVSTAVEVIGHPEAPGVSPKVSVIGLAGQITNIKTDSVVG